MPSASGPTNRCAVNYPDSMKPFGKDRKTMDVNPLYTKIDKTIQVNAGVIVLENSNGFPRNESNLYLKGMDGKILWKAEKPDPSTFFMRVKLNDDGDTFSAYTLNGHACELDLISGKLISFTTFR